MVFPLSASKQPAHRYDADYPGVETTEASCVGRDVIKISCSADNDVTAHEKVVLIHTGEEKPNVSAQTTALSCTDDRTSQDNVQTNTCLAIPPHISADKRCSPARREYFRATCRNRMHRRQFRLQRHVRSESDSRRDEKRGTAWSRCSILGYPKRASRPALRPVSDVLYRGRPDQFIAQCPHSAARFIQRTSILFHQLCVI
jgi:hypothetical protein